MFDWQHVSWELMRLLLAGVMGAAIGFNVQEGEVP